MQVPRIAAKQRLLYELLVQEIRTGRFPPGTRMPSEWQLVRRFQVSRTTVRTALDQLAIAGLIERFQGLGTVVHAEALRRLTASEAPPRDVAVVLQTKKLTNPIFSGILESFQAHVPSSVRIRLFFHETLTHEAYAGAEAVLVDGTFGAEAIAAIHHRHPRLIVLNRLVPGILSVCTDNHAGGMLMAEHVIACGHRRIAVLHFGDSDTEQEFIDRRRGIRSACVASTVSLVEIGLDLIRSSASDLAQAMKRLLRSKAEVTAILCVTDALALGAIEYLTIHGITVPEHMSVVGFDDLPFSRFSYPPLTTIRQPVEDIGEAVAASVLALIEGRPAHPNRMFPPQLVLRASA